SSGARALSSTNGAHALHSRKGAHALYSKKGAHALMRGDDLVKPAGQRHRRLHQRILRYQEIVFIPGDRDPYRTIHCLWRHTK
ncbi:Uncharacterized protein FWK35_00020626, partial [Aphis craccivora]